MEQTTYEDRILVCVDCGEEFVFPADAQQYFAEKGYTDDPKRCRHCHTEHKKRQRDPQHHQARPN